MSEKNLKIWLFVFVLITVSHSSSGQNTVPYGINYQAVARDNYGKELVNKNIDVRFSIISENPLGTVVYQELHSAVITSKYGVFSIIIGKGTQTGGVYSEFSQINWSQAFHYLKVEVKFENDFIDMGTMQFLAVPYALYAQKSLEPGPQGPKGDQGDPASDKQTLSFNGDNLSISGGNTVNLSTLNIPHQLSILGDTLSILGGNKVGLTNQIQDLQLDVNNKLKISKNTTATEIDLTRFLDNTDNQALTYNPATRILGISGNAGTIDLTELKNDADSDPTNEIQSLSYNQSTNTLNISDGNSVVLGSMIAFRAEKNNPAGPTGLEVTMIFDVIKYNDGSAYNNSTGEFVAPVDGIYTFNVRYDADLGANISIYLNGVLYEKIADAISSSGAVYRNIIMKLLATNSVKVVVSTGIATKTGTGSFSGYRVN